MHLCASGVAYSYGRRVVLRNIEFSLHTGELVALLGINGAGKSTLLRVLLGLEKPQSGHVVLNDRSLETFRRRDLACCMAYVPQAHTAPFPYTVNEVVLLGRIAQRGYLRAPDATDRAVAQRAIAQLGIGALADRPYTTLSGGERQLTLIARALTQEAGVLILDEPASALDYGNQIRLLDRLRALADRGYAILFTTHHPEHVQIAADRVALLIDGRMAADGSPKTVLTPETLRQLYGIEVEWLERSNGTSAFWPRLQNRHQEFRPCMK